MLHLPGLTFDHGEDIAALRETVQQFAVVKGQAWEMEHVILILLV